VQIQETALVQHIIFDARNGIQALDTARYRLQAAHNARVAADRVLLGEERRFSVGRSTTFLVLQRDVEAANDQGRELQAQTDLNKAVVELDRVSGTIFEKNGIKLTNINNPELSQLMHAAGVDKKNVIDLRP
jgi:outer membrane protein